MAQHDTHKAGERGATGSASALSGRQIRAARALLGLSQSRLADIAGLSRQTVETVEHRDALPVRSGQAIGEALSARGVQFIDKGVRLTA